MAMDPVHLRELVIRPALQLLKLHSPAAEELVLGTACVESKCGTFLKQLGSGPALGIFQMEPRTHDDLWSNFLAHRPELASALSVLFTGPRPAAELMIWNLRYAAAMCRVHYFRVPAALPPAGDLPAQAAYWKRYYNTTAGAGRVEDYLKDWNRYT